MAIERISETEPLPPESTNETVDIPASILAGQTVNPGDVVRLEVVSVAEDGTITVKYATEAEPEGGSDEMAAEFDQAPTTQTI